MSYALGQPVPLTALVRDAAGVLDDATSVTLTITLPDGTTATPAVVNPPAVTGTYTVDYLPTVAGLHSYRWVFTGVNASAPPADSFYVDPVALVPIVGLAEAREQCRVYTSDHDVLLQRYMRAATGHCETRTQVWRRQTLSKTTAGGCRVIRLRRPVISVTSVTVDGVAQGAGDWTLDRSLGLLYRGTAGARCWWPDAEIQVVYVAGAADGLIPEEIRQGTLHLVEFLWNTQRGGPAPGGELVLPVGFTLPNAVRQQWANWIEELVA